MPGHHLQVALGQELRGLPDFRRHLGPTAYFEGWGLYTERLADEMGLYSGDLDRLGMLSFDAWRAARLVVDTGIHAMGWSRQQAIEYMLAHTALAPNNIANEVDRYIALPGQALAYKTGQLELLRIREEAQRRMGAAFDIRGFHDAILSDGALPLPTLAEVVYAWADDAVAKHRPGGHRRADRGRELTAPVAASRRFASNAGKPDRDSVALPLVGNDPVLPAPAPSTTEPDKPPATAQPSRIAIAVRSLSRVLRNPDIRALELSWTVGVGVDWAILVVALVVAYDAGGAVAVGLVSLFRMLPAMVVNILVDATRAPRPERVLVAVNLLPRRGRRGRRRGDRRGPAVRRVPRVAGASAAGALVRPTTLALLPSVAVRPEDLVAANTAGALGESLGTFAGPLITGLVVASSGPAPAAAIAAAGASSPPRSSSGSPSPRRPGPRPRTEATACRSWPGSGSCSGAGRRPSSCSRSASRPPSAARSPRSSRSSRSRSWAWATRGSASSAPPSGRAGSSAPVFAVAMGTGGRLAGMFAAALVAWGAPFVLIGVAPSPGSR